MLLALRITKPIIRTEIILQIIQLDCNLLSSSFLSNIVCNYKGKRIHFCPGDTVFKSTFYKKTPKPNPSYFSFLFF